MQELGKQFDPEVVEIVVQPWGLAGVLTNLGVSVAGCVCCLGFIENLSCYKCFVPYKGTERDKTEATNSNAGPIKELLSIIIWRDN